MNLFHGHVDNDRTYIQESATGTLVFVRPHLLDIDRQPAGPNHFRATTKHINAAGPLARIEAVTEWGAPVHIEMSQERLRDLRLVKGEVVFIIPREVAVFWKNGSS
ncbi:MAG TPA: TOBE-like domain-containing protein [Candidatus Acidoferrum sp.]|nr:TOBE-like domain-containing protein [Candidatus Acidoferrum sp.]